MRKMASWILRFSFLFLVNNMLLEGAPAPTEDLECKNGDGIGGSEKNTGQKFASMDECIAFVKKEHPTANGATLETSCSECKCFAEFDMTDWKDNSKYKSCLFKQKEEEPKPDDPKCTKDLLDAVCCTSDPESECGPNHVCGAGGFCECAPGFEYFPYGQCKKKLLCDELIVTGDNFGEAIGTYQLSDEKVSKFPDKPVYKLGGKDRYIFFNPSFHGWRISLLENLNNGDYLYASFSNAVEPWVESHSWKHFTESNTIQVQCAKLDSKSCNSKPCENGGECIGVQDDFYCACQPNWKGKICSEPIFKDLVCANLTVFGDAYGKAVGSYIISERKAASSPDNPVYELKQGNRYIYYYPNDNKGWRIAGIDGLSGDKEGSYWYASFLDDTVQPYFNSNLNKWKSNPEGRGELQVKCATEPDPY